MNLVQDLGRKTQRLDRDSRRRPWTDCRDTDVADVDFLVWSSSANSGVGYRPPFALGRMPPGHCRGGQSKTEHGHQSALVPGPHGWLVWTLRASSMIPPFDAGAVEQNADTGP
jgi:hypothetical protein